MDTHKIGAFIAQLRKEQGLTQQDLADKLGITNKAVSKWERGDGYPDVTLIPRLAEVLAVSADELLQGERISPPISPPSAPSFNNAPAPFAPPPSADTEQHDTYTDDDDETRIFQKYTPIFPGDEKDQDEDEPFDNNEEKQKPVGFIAFCKSPLGICLVILVDILLIGLLVWIGFTFLHLKGDSPSSSASSPSSYYETSGISTQSSSSSPTAPENSTASTTSSTSSTTTSTTSSTESSATTFSTTLPPPDYPAIPGNPAGTLSAKAAIIADSESGDLLYSYHENRRCYPASLTKLLTAITALDNCPANTILEVGDEIDLIGADSQIAYLSKGDQPTLTQLLRAMLIESGCDAAYTIAARVGYRIAGDTSLTPKQAVDVFCRRMNSTATQLGLTGSHFSNPDGFYADDHYTTPMDMLKIVQKAMSVELIRDTVGRYTKSDRFEPGRDHTWKNLNQLLNKESPYYYPGANGLKTGYCSEAGYCLAASAEKDGKEVFVLLFDAPTRNASFADGVTLLNAGFFAVNA